LVEATNNQAKTSTLIQGLTILKERGINKIIVVGESTMIIHHMHYQSTPHEIQLSRFINRAQRLEKIYESIEYYQVLRHYNSSADLQARSIIKME